MAHNIFSNRFYGHRQPAWHGLGMVTQEDMTANEVLTALGGGYWFEKRPVTVFMNGENVEVGDYAIVRSPVIDDPVERNFGYVTKQYNIIQPLTICELFDENVKQPVETFGMLGKGEKLFLTWKLPAFLVNGDEVNLNAFVACGYDGKFGASLYTVYTRVVCQNTFSIAVNEADNGKGYSKKLWSGKHNSSNIERDLAIWLEHAQMSAENKAGIVREGFINMSNFEIKNKETVFGILRQIYPTPPALPADYPEKLRAEKQEDIDKQTEYAENDVESVFSLFEGEGTAIDATGWGLFNAVTEYENWGRMTRKAPEYSIVLGNRANTMNKAMDIINNTIKNW